MSRQFDEYMEDKFEYQGERKSLIYPKIGRASCRERVSSYV